jgi:hypothetical protein
MTTGAAAEERLAQVAAVARVYRAKLDAARIANADDPRFVTGTTHAYAALERIDRALAGETDPVRLGIADPETAARPEPATPSLFDEAASS